MLGMKRKTLSALLLFSLAALVQGCGGGGGHASCTLGAGDCDMGQVCEQLISGDGAQCFAPVQIEGRVFDAIDDMGVAGASVVALDVNGGARSVVAESDLNGHYVLPVAVTRNDDGSYANEALTLRVSATGYQDFPKAPRTALPIELGTGATDGGTSVVQNAATDVALIPLPGDVSGLHRIEGHVDGNDTGGVLVIAEVGGTAVTTAISDSDGDFVLFNVPDGAIDVKGFRQGLVVTPASVTMAGADVTGVLLATSTDGLATVSGSVNLVNPGDGSLTSVILVVASTFDADAVRGEAPAGLRAGDVSGAWTIEGVPPGRYVVLAAFENDFIVRDPDAGISGTDIVTVDVPAGGDVAAGDFKITGAMAVVSPGADGIELITDPNPTLRWQRDSSIDGYLVRVIDALGNEVDAAEVVNVSGQAVQEYVYAGPALQSGMIYQFRVVSFADSPSMDRLYRSATEDLKGVFQFQAAP